MMANTPIRTVRIEDALWDPAKAKAAERGEDLSDVMRSALEEYLERPPLEPAPVAAEFDMRTIVEEEWQSVAAGEAVLCGYPVQCSACIGQGEQTVYPPGQVVLAVITRRGNVGREGFWHGWWSCTGPGTQEHWERGSIKRRLEETGSATP